MPGPFYKTAPGRPNVIQRLLGKLPVSNALVDLINLLADAPSVQSLSQDAIGDLNTRYRINIVSKFQKDLQGLYEKYLLYSLEDKHFSDTEIADLKHLKLLFGITDPVANSIRQRAIEKVYTTSARQAAADRRLDDDERDFLRSLEENLQLPTPIAERIYREAAQSQLQEYFDAATRDDRLAPEEEGELNAIAASLGVPVSLDEKSRTMYNRLKLYWMIENGEVPTVQTELRLQRGELCYAHQEVEWYENRTVTRSIRYGGVGGRVKIAKGIYFRIGEVAVQRIQEDIVKHIDSGTAVLTNKRLLFLGGRKNSTIQLKKIIDFTPYSNGIDIQKDTGKPPFLKFDTNVDLFALKLDRAIRDANA